MLPRRPQPPRILRWETDTEDTTESLFNVVSLAKTIINTLSSARDALVIVRTGLMFDVAWLLDCNARHPCTEPHRFSNLWRCRNGVSTPRDGSLLGVWCWRTSGRVPKQELTLPAELATQMTRRPVIFPSEPTRLGDFRFTELEIWWHPVARGLATRVRACCSICEAKPATEGT